jgi:predicted ATPase
VYARVANRLAELIEGARSVRVDVDDRRELLTLMLTERDGTEHEARSLSDGTLRFLALAILESDSEARGVLCMEEPENGIHPERIPAMLQLLQDLAVDPREEGDEDNPLRQVIVNTHSPVVAAAVPEDSLLVAIPQAIRRDGQRTSVAAFRWLPGTWRAAARPDLPTIPLGQLVSYLNPLERPRPVKLESPPKPRRAATAR